MSITVQDVSLEILAEQVRKGDLLSTGHKVTKIVMLEMSVCISTAREGQTCSDVQLYRATPMRVIRNR